MHPLAKKNHYQRLNVAFDAPLAQITQAYREIAAVYHPDSGLYSDKENALSDQHLEIFKLITESYNTLRDEKKRVAYDLTLPPEYKKDSWTDLSKTKKSPSKNAEETTPKGKPIKTNMDLSQLNKTVSQGFRFQQQAQPTQPEPASFIANLKNLFAKK